MDKIWALCHNIGAQQYHLFYRERPYLWGLFEVYDVVDLIDAEGAAGKVKTYIGRAVLVLEYFVEHERREVLLFIDTGGGSDAVEAPLDRVMDAIESTLGKQVRPCGKKV